MLRRDPRTDEYARLLVERSLDVQAGWQVAIRGNHLGRPLLDPNRVPLRSDGSVAYSV